MFDSTKCCEYRHGWNKFSSFELVAHFFRSILYISKNISLCSWRTLYGYNATSWHMRARGRIWADRCVGHFDDITLHMEDLVRLSHFYDMWAEYQGAICCCCFFVISHKITRLFWSSKKTCFLLPGGGMSFWPSRKVFLEGGRPMKSRIGSWYAEKDVYGVQNECFSEVTITVRTYTVLHRYKCVLLWRCPYWKQ